MRKATHPASTVIAIVLAAALWTLPAGAVGQSIVTGDLSGTVADSLGRPIPGALLTLVTPTGVEYRATLAGASGEFAFSLLLPGSYGLQAEALGRRPLLVSTLRVEPGRTTTLRLALAPSQPPVERRDTVAFAALPQAFGGQLGWLDAATIDALPISGPEIARLVKVDGAADSNLGIDGLPERYTIFYVDGQRFQPARHPAAAGDPAGGMLLPTRAIAGLRLPRAEDIEIVGGSVFASSGVARMGEPNLFGTWGGDAGWRSEALADPPAFNSWWAGGAASLPLSADTAGLHVAVESGHSFRPRAPLVSDSIGRLLGSEAAGAALPQLAEDRWTSGSARLEWTLSNGGAFQVGMTGSVFEKSVAGWPTPELRYLVAPTGLEGSDVLAGASLALPIRGLVSLELRAGGSVSKRRFGGLGADSSTVTFLVDPPLALGGALQERGEVTRSEGGATAVVHMASGPHTGKAGFRAGVAAHEYDLMQAPRAVFLLGRASSGSSAGLYFERMGAVPAVTFVVPEGEIFGQYGWRASPSFNITVAGSVGSTLFPSSDIRRDPQWLALTGLANDSVPDRTRYAGGIAHAVWDPGANGRTVIEGGLSLQHGEVDPGALYEVISNGGLVPVRRVSGSLSTWPRRPATGTGARASSLTLIDPDLSLPATARGVAGIAHRFENGTTVRAEASVRRTDYLLRRADLNGALRSGLSGEGGREVQSRPELTAGVVGPATTAWRRFPEYDAVWALNGDGWSEHRALALSLDRKVGARGSVFASYTRSETRDNLLGLAAGDPSAALAPGISGVGTVPWDEGRSDLDIPHRASAGLSLPLPGTFLGDVSALYVGRSGTPFTPMVRRGLDVNGDGSYVNDVALIPEDEDIRSLAARAGCENLSAGAFPERNSCRGPAVHELDLRLTLGPLAVGTSGMELAVEVINLTDQQDGPRDEALLLLSPNAAISVNAGRLSIPYVANPGFGSILGRSDRGRQLRISLRLGAYRP